ncbi:uncharacterized protein N7477_005685 [Penicillium maclennaniae]|uniref:uncharacterized protein n=1 Tax=Penicillium maclennaniae TaxID=1343394 RepID=UPI0025418BA8|nr:uncharacterized protein N7477_005685 [Penicillium maclennaniae]KAJ5670322.1 hypothetical protein N7477_005685 [Penicillium maclennaniae]
MGRINSTYSSDCANVRWIAITIYNTSQRATRTRHRTSNTLLANGGLEQDISITPGIQKEKGKIAAGYLNIMSKSLAKKWKIMRGYRFLNLLQLPVWLSLMESMRAMTGNQNGIIPYLLSFVSGHENAASLPALEPSLATEGALWFPNLLAGDPTGALPLLLSASIILNIRRGWGITTPAGDLADLPTAQLYRATFFRGLGVFLQILGLNIGVAAFANELPAALMIYWITSTNVATLQTFLLEKYMFMRPPIPNFQKKYMVYQRPGVSDPFKLKLT